ncbi:ArsR/SmtB family transcription factor [Kribbella sp. DT2]|uniref:ArsR/SmtB family transcription factor n=1 Tax=Kribbella sp. DT2 TaxID=3393427 RepID=UPI003CEE86F6
MLRIHFTGQDLRRITVAAGPASMWELLLSLHMVQHRDGRLVFGDWRRDVRAKVAPDQLRLLLELAPASGYSPDFLTPAEPPAGFEAALQTVLSTPRQSLRQQLSMISGRRPPSTWIQALANGEPRALRRLDDAIRAYHEAAIAPYWSSIGMLVAADQARRGRTLVSHGVDDLLSSLHPRVRWEPPELQVLGMRDRHLQLEGRGIHLQPSAFCWQVPTKLRDPRLPPILVYPVDHTPGILGPGLGGAVQAADPLSVLLGVTRATALEATFSGCTTTQMAELCQVSLASASHQAGVLRSAGLITTRRTGSSVRHEITERGLCLLSARQQFGRPAH